MRFCTFPYCIWDGRLTLNGRKGLVVYTAENPLVLVLQMVNMLSFWLQQDLGSTFYYKGTLSLVLTAVHVTL